MFGAGISSVTDCPLLSDDQGERVECATRDCGWRFNVPMNRVTPSYCPFCTAERKRLKANGKVVL